MIDWNRKKLVDEVATIIEENLNKKKLQFGTDLEEIVRNLRNEKSTQETESNVLYLAWNIPSGVLPVAGEAVINLLVEESFRK